MLETLPSIVVLVLFFVLHLLVGALMPYRAGRADPFFWVLIRNAGFEMRRRLNRPDRGSSELFVRGVVVVVIMGGFGALIASTFVNINGYPYGWLALLVLLFLTVSVMPFLKVMQQVLKHLVTGKDAGKAADILAPFLPAVLKKPDAHGVIRETLGLAALRLSQYLVAPAFFLALFGIYGLVLYVTFTALHDALGEEDIFFGGMIRAIDKALNFFPGIVTLWLICLSAIFVSRSSPLRAFKIALTQKNIRLCIMGAFAGALGITLGNAKHWIGAKESSARATPEDLKRGAMLYFVVFLFMLTALSALIMTLY